MKASTSGYKVAEARIDALILRTLDNARLSSIADPAGFDRIPNGTCQ